MAQIQDLLAQMSEGMSGLATALQAQQKATDKLSSQVEELTKKNIELETRVKMIDGAVRAPAGFEGGEMPDAGAASAPVAPQM